MNTEAAMFCLRMQQTTVDNIESSASDSDSISSYSGTDENTQDEEELAAPLA